MARYRFRSDRLQHLLAALTVSCALFVAAGTPASAASSADTPRVTFPSAPPVPLVLALQQPPASQDEFVPVKDLPVQEQLPAAPLLVGAYSFVWLMLVVYVVVLWRRLGAVEREIQGLQRRVTPATTGEQRRA